MVGKRLGPSETNIGRRGWTGYNSDLAEPVQHNECHTDIAQPFHRGESDETMLGNAKQTLQPVTDTGQTKVPTISANAIVHDQVTTFDTDLDAISVQGHHAVPGYGRIVRGPELR